MNSFNKNSLFNHFKQYLSLYSKAFDKSLFNTFFTLVTSIICLEHLYSVKFLYDKFISKYFCGCLNKFYYFLSSNTFDVSKISLITLNILLSIIPSIFKNKICIYLTIDDTLQSKFGTHFDCYQKFFDHAKHNDKSYLFGHCFVMLCAGVPIIFNNKCKYITVPLCIKLYDKSQTKLEMAASMVQNTMQILKDYQVILLCDSWYTKKPILQVVKKNNNLDIIAGVRADTVLYELPPKHNAKRGRPRKRGEKIDYKTLEYKKEGDYYITTKKCITNLYDKEVYITITLKDIEKFKSARMYISTIEQEKINSIDDKEEENSENKFYEIYKNRWKIEVIFYELKKYWSLGEYMVRSKTGIENYVNMIGVGISMVIIMPFKNNELSKYEFKSPQEIKNSFGDRIKEELILSNLLKTLKLNKNNIEIKDIIEYLTWIDSAS